MKVGNVYRLKTPMLGESKNAVGVAYEEYPDFSGVGTGVSVIFEGGNYDGFSEEDQENFLEKVDHDPKIAAYYRFKNVMQLSRDFDNGVFAEALLLGM